MDLYQSISGMVEVELTGADIASALAAITEAGIQLRSVHQTDDVTVRFTILRRDYRTLKKLTERRGETLKLLSRTGLYWWGKAALGRPVLLVGMVFLLCLVFCLPTRVLFVQVEGNSTIPSRLVLEAADQCGISFGASRREVRSERVKNALLQAVPELQWAGVNTYGCVAVISVRERTITAQTEEKSGVCSIVAVREGIITSCTAVSGNLLCRPGQAVIDGEILISGYTDCGLTIQATQAEGEVYARTVRDLTVISPADYIVKQDSGERKHSYSLIVGKKRINLWKDSGIWDTICDRIYEEYYVTLPGGFQLPFGLAVEEYAVSEIFSASAEESAVRERMTAFASNYIRQQMVAGVIQNEAVTITRAEGCFILAGKYICTEMIGKVQWEQIGEHNGESD